MYILNLLYKYYLSTTPKNSCFVLSTLPCRHFVKQLVGIIYASCFYCRERWTKCLVARGSRGFEELHGVGATSLPTRSCRWTQGGRGRPEGAGPSACVSRAGAALAVHTGISTVAGARRLAPWRAISTAKGRPVTSCCESSRP